MLRALGTPIQDILGGCMGVGDAAVFSSSMEESSWVSLPMEPWCRDGVGIGREA